MRGRRSILTRGGKRSRWGGEDEGECQEEVAEELEERELDNEGGG